MNAVWENTKFCVILQLIWLSHSQIYCARRQRGQNVADEDVKKMQIKQKDVGPQTEGAGAAAGRWSTWSTKAKKEKTRPTPSGVTLDHHCDYIGQQCMQSYQTGKLCGKTVYYQYSTFDNYCMLDFVNCMEGYDVWQVAHMGGCFDFIIPNEYQHYVYQDDWFLDQYYVLDDH